jgi:phosphopantothenate---cysteine ligase (ATP)
VVFVSKSNPTNGEGENGDGEVKEEWVRVPRARRGKSFSGIEGLVGRAEIRNKIVGGGEKKEEKEEVMGSGTMEIEGLIIPKVVGVHKRMIEAAEKAKRS